MAKDEKPLVLLTGAKGGIGADFADEYVARYAGDYGLRLGVRDAEYRHAEIDDIAVFDIEEGDSIGPALAGVECIVHLAGNPEWEAPFDELIGPNIRGVYNLFEAAREAGVRRIVYASSVHAIMGYPVDVQAGHDDPPRADTLYGVTKVFGEAMCSSYAHLYGMSCLAVRIGAYVPDDEREQRVYGSANPQLLDIVVSRRDLCDLLHRCIMAPASLTYGIFNGISNNRFKRMDIENARELLGYEPQDDAFEWSRIVEFGPEEKV